MIFLKGLPASGKSTYAKKLIDANPGVYKRINKDDMRAMMDNSHYTKGNESFVNATKELLVLHALKQGYSPIVDDTNFHEKHKETLQDALTAFNAGENTDIKITEMFFDVSPEECIERDSKRENPVGAKVIRTMYNKYLKPEGYKWLEDKNPDGQPAVIVDLDGTLSLLNGRSPYAATECGSDVPNIPVLETVKALKKAGYVIILLSGRDGSGKEETFKWLEHHDVVFDLFLMREAGDQQSDETLKRDFYLQRIEQDYSVKMVIDDRPKVRRMWISLGLFVLSAYQDPYNMEF